MEELLKQFNDFFGETASAAIVNGRLEITIGSLTMIISLPEHVGGRNDPKV